MNNLKIMACGMRSFPYGCVQWDGTPEQAEDILNWVASETEMRGHLLKACGEQPAKLFLPTLEGEVCSLEAGGYLVQSGYANFNAFGAEVFEKYFSIAP
jgi:hypothetical protein